MKPQTFFNYSAFSELLDITDPLPGNAFSFPILKQYVGYKADIQDAGTDAGLSARNGRIFTDRFNKPKSIDSLNQFVIPPAMQTVCFSANGEQDHTDICGWITDTPGETHPAVFRHFGTDLLKGLDGSAGQRTGGLQGMAMSLTDRVGAILKVVGWSADANGDPHPVLWTLDYNTDPATQQVTALTPATGKALKIHNNGSIVGWYHENGIPNAFKWTPDAGFTKIGTLPGGNFCVATGISENGTVCGYGTNAAGTIKAFEAKPGQAPAELPSRSGPAFAYDINDSDVIVGSANRVFFTSTAIFAEMHATVWDWGIPYDLNDEYSEDPDFLLSTSRLTKAWAINNNSEVVGTGLVNGINNGWKCSYNRKPNPVLLRYRHFMDVYWESMPPSPHSGRLFHNNEGQVRLQLLISEEARKLSNTKVQKSVRSNALKAARDLINASIKEY